MTERLHFHFSLSCTGEGNGNPLQCSCLENPRDGKPGGLLSMGSQSRTRLKRLSSSSMFSAFFPLGKEKAVLNSINRDSVGNCFARIYCALLLFMYKAVLITGHLKSLLTIQVESIEILPCLDDQIHKKCA
ncbi:unnamed protein product [Rangifer tarandus platyrhynchus]|uniref:Uncharacterized protein n=1 Tax=Rangifer tarandus platyrhynchus TaxID=3082113 RepID=A0ABN8YNM6_RANTA|nr:unnamed protein product [Rangifer tarandus platyrhynchus]